MKKKLEKKINTILSIFITIVLLPLLVTTVIQKLEVESLLAGGLSMADTEIAESMEGSDITDRTEWNRPLKNQKEVLAKQPEEDISTAGGAKEFQSAGAEGELDETEGKTLENVEEKVIQIAAKEISPKYNKQAIMAQCVIARTNLYDAWETKTAEPKGLSIEEMQKLWGSDFQRIYQEMKKDAASTEQEVLTWNGNYIYAAYHACSSGSTRNMSDLYEDANMPYLKELPCHEDPTAEGYLAVLYWTEAEFIKKCGAFFPDADIKSIDEIEIIKRDTSDYVLELKLGKKTCTGEEFREKFGLNSACFTLAEIDGQVRIVTKGLGHGLGLSQYTANLLAAEGKNYKEILAYFYPDTELTKVQKEK